MLQYVDGVRIQHFILFGSRCYLKGPGLAGHQLPLESSLVLNSGTRSAIEWEEQIKSLERD